MSKLVIFDGNALIHRAYHALPSSLKTRSGEPINAVYGVVSMLLRVVQDLKPDYIVFTWDRPEPTFRNELFKEYQSHRPEADDELISQFAKAQKVIKAMNIPSLDKNGYEADDVIGTLSKQLSDQSMETLIVTGDRDILQLVDKNVKLYMPGRGLSDAKEYGSTETIERMGVPPEQIIDFKALVGDPSDNYKGVPGIGPKTATDLLGKYNTLENIYENLDEIKESVRKKLVEHKESAFMSQKLATIVRDVDINFSLDEAKKWKLDSPELLKIFDEYGFRSLKKRVEEAEAKKIAEKQMSLL